jgi:hypothetical protein
MKYSVFFHGHFTETETTYTIMLSTAFTITVTTTTAPTTILTHFKKPRPFPTSIKGGEIS